MKVPMLDMAAKNKPEAKPENRQIEICLCLKADGIPSTIPSVPPAINPKIIPCLASLNLFLNSIFITLSFLLVVDSWTIGKSRYRMFLMKSKYSLSGIVGSIINMDLMIDDSLVPNMQQTGRFNLSVLIRLINVIVAIDVHFVPLSQ